MKQLLLFITLLIPLQINAQENNVELVTDRPDQTESATVVPLKHFQIESGFIMSNDESGSFKHNSFTLNTTLLRYSVSTNFELRLGLGYMKDKIEDNSNHTTNKGFSPLYTGFKAKIADEKNILPDIAFLGGLILPFTASENYKPSYTSAVMRFAFSHTLSNRLSLGYNLGAEWDGNNPSPGYFYSLALGIGITDRIGIFIENYGLLIEKGHTEHLFDAGITYLILPNLQVDISGGFGINKEPFDNFIGIGLSLRLPS